MPLIRAASVLIAALLALPALAATPEASRCVPPSISYDAKAAFDACSKLLENENLSDVERARILTLRGRASRVDDKFDAAAADLDEAIKLVPDLNTALTMRAWNAVDQRDFNTAINLVNRLLALSPDDSEAYSIAGTIASRRNDYRAAKHYYDKSIALKPDNVLARFNRMILYKNAGNNHNVAVEAEALLALNSPELDTKFATLQGRRMTFRSNVWLERALIFERMGQTEQAERAFADWIRAEPGAVSYGYRAAFRDRLSHYDEALADLKVALADDPGFWMLHDTMGRVYTYTHRVEEAISAFTRAIELNAKAGGSYWMRAMLERHLKRPDAALRDALKAIAVDEDVRVTKIKTLTRLGYLQIGPNDETNPLPAVAEAVQACMLDEECK
jgi:superkiller protein 3